MDGFQTLGSQSSNKSKRHNITFDALMYSSSCARTFCSIKKNCPRLEMLHFMLLCQSDFPLVHHHFGDAYRTHMFGRLSFRYHNRLIKQTYSVYVETPDGRRKWHLGRTIPLIVRTAR